MEAYVQWQEELVNIDCHLKILNEESEKHKEDHYYLIKAKGKPWIFFYINKNGERVTIDIKKYSRIEALLLNNKDVSTISRLIKNHIKLILTTDESEKTIKK